MWMGTAIWHGIPSTQRNMIVKKYDYPNICVVVVGKEKHKLLRWVVMLMLRPKRRATFCHEFYIFSALLFCVCSSRRPVTSAVHLFFLRLTRNNHIVLFWRQWKFHIILRIYRTCMRIVCAQKKNSRRILSLAMGGGIMFQCTIFGVYLISTWPTAVFKLKFLDRQKKKATHKSCERNGFFFGCV